MQQAAAAEVVDDLLGDAFVVAEHHALKHVRHRRVQPRAQVRARGQPKPVDDALHAPATTDEAQVVERRGEDDVLAAALEVAPVVEPAVVGRLRQRLDLHLVERQQRALGQRPAVVEGELVLAVETQAEMGRLVDRDAVDGGDEHREVERVVALRRQVDQRRAQGDPLADAPGELRVGDARQPGGPGGDAHREEQHAERDRERRRWAYASVRRRLAATPADVGARPQGRRRRRAPRRRQDAARSHATSAQAGGRQTIARHRPAQ